MNLPRHLYSLDIARGLAAFAVVFWHWQHFFFEGGTPDSGFERDGQPFYLWLRPLYEFGYHAVPFFFLLSGFVFFWLYRESVESGRCSARAFAVLRFARLYPLHLATLILVLLLQGAFSKIIGGYFVYAYNDFYHFLLQILFISHWGFEKGHSFNAPVWSVSIEVGLYGIFFVYCLIKASNPGKLLTALLLVAVFLIADPASRWLPAMLAFFIGGLTFELTRTYLRTGSRKLDVPIALTASVAWACALSSETLLISRHLTIVTLFPLSVAALVIAETRLPVNLSAFAWIGNISYSVYLLHFPLQIMFVIMVSTLGHGRDAFNSPVILLLFFLVLLIASLMSYNFYEVPLRKGIRSRFLKERFSRTAGSPPS